jgi:hypothetical protein
MRTSPAMLYKNYLKKSSEPNEPDETPKSIQQTTTPKTTIKLSNEGKEEFNNKERITIKNTMKKKMCY